MNIQFFNEQPDGINFDYNLVTLEANKRQIRTQGVEWKQYFENGLGKAECIFIQVNDLDLPGIKWLMLKTLQYPQLFTTIDISVPFNQTKLNQKTPFIVMNILNLELDSLTWQNPTLPII
jgi:hypothetical protein